MQIRDLPRVNGVKFGDIYLKPGNIDQTASRSCRMILLEDKSPDLPLGRSGSSTLVRYGNQKFVVMTRHQLGLKPNEPPDTKILDTIRVVSGDKRLTNIPLVGCIFETSNSDQEYHDLLFFQVSDDWAHANLDAPYFARLDGFSQLTRKISRLYGCPILPDVMNEYLDNFESGSIGTIHLKTLVAHCEYNESYRSKAEYFRHYRGGPNIYGVDGISGGPLYSLVEGAGGYEMMLDGIVVRAGNGSVYIVDTDYMTKILRESAN